MKKILAVLVLAASSAAWAGLVKIDFTGVIGTVSSNSTPGMSLETKPGYAGTALSGYFLVETGVGTHGNPSISTAYGNSMQTGCRYAYGAVCQDNLIGGPTFVVGWHLDAGAAGTFDKPTLPALGFETANMYDSRIAGFAEWGVLAQAGSSIHSLPFYTYTDLSTILSLTMSGPNGAWAGDQLDQYDAVDVAGATSYAYFSFEQIQTDYRDSSSYQTFGITIGGRLTSVSASAVADVNAVPEPGSLALVAAGLIAIAAARRRRI